jgi:hypothetical protein
MRRTCPERFLPLVIGAPADTLGFPWAADTDCFEILLSRRSTARDTLIAFAFDISFSTLCCDAGALFILADVRGIDGTQAKMIALAPCQADYSAGVRVAQPKPATFEGHAGRLKYSVEISQQMRSKATTPAAQRHFEICRLLENMDGVSDDADVSFRI